MTEEEIKDKLTKTCPCRQVTRATIKTAISQGADTLEKVKNKTGAMTGSCKGSRCKCAIQNLIDQHISV